MAVKKFGYVRVSTKDQNEDRQIESMRELGIEERDIFIDKQSGKNFERPDYQLLKRSLREGDILYIHSLDRFGRNKEQILKEWEYITKEIKADIIVLDMPLLDTTKHKDSLGSLISDIVLQVLSWLAEEERNKIKTRQSEGIKVAHKKGVKFGRPALELPAEWESLYKSWKAGEIKAVEFMAKVDMKKPTFYKKVKEYEEQMK